MKTFRFWISKARGAFGQHREDHQLGEEVRAHLDLLKELYISRGIPAEEAERLAHRQFGSVTVLKERQRAQRGILAPVEWWRDICFGLRMLRKRWASNMVVVLALALGIGMNTAVFTFVNALLLRPPSGVPAVKNLLEVWLHSRSGSGIQSYTAFDYPDYVYYRDHARSLNGLLAFDGDGAEAIWNRAGSGQITKGELVSGNYFSVLGVGAALGRTISADDDHPGNPSDVVVLGNSFWRTQMGSDPTVVGKTMVLNGTRFNVVGVAPQGFKGLLVGSEPQFWAPLAVHEGFTHDKTRMTDRNSFWLIIAGRMKPGSNKTQVQAEMHLLGSQIEQLHPNAENQMDPLVYAADLVPGPYRGYVGAFTGLLLVVFILVLLIACVNAATMMLARSGARIREMAIRSALGAGRARLIRQMLIESLMLSSIGGAAAVLVGFTMARLLVKLTPSSLPITIEVPLDWRVLLFNMAVSIAAGMLFGIVPAIRSSAVNAVPVLKEETPTAAYHKSRLRTILLTVQIAACCILLSGATLCVRSLLHANSINPGFDTHHIALEDLNPAALGYSSERTRDFYKELIQRVRNLPGVVSASYTDHLPLGPSSSETSVGRRQGEDLFGVRVFQVDAGFFETMGIPLLTGRGLTPTEAEADAPATVVINEYLAGRLWPGENPIGKRIAMGGEKTMSEVIGVVANGKYQTLGEMPVAAVYRGGLMSQRTLLVRGSGDAHPMLNAMQHEIRVVDPMMAGTSAQTIEEYMALPLFPARTTGLLLGVSGFLALVLTTIGLFGVVAYIVSQRTREIGIRMALGARRADVLRLVMKQGFWVTLIGLVAGSLGAVGGDRVLSPLLYGVSATDPLTLLGVGCGLAVVTMLACYLPARRAMRVDPAAALRYE